VVLAWLKATNVVDADLLGIASTAAASALAWVQTRDSQNLAEAYRAAANELTLIGGLEPPTEAEAWSRYVSEGERAISREHTLWRARRSLDPLEKNEEPGIKPGSSVWWRRIRDSNS
jgi:hypothetical protein